MSVPTTSLPSPALPTDETVVSTSARRSANSATADVRRRVESLRLQNNVQAGPRASARLVWAMCLFLMGATVILAYLAFVAKSSPATTAAAATKSSSAADEKKESDAAAATPMPAAGAGGDVVLETSGYVTVKRKILVSPQVSGRLTMVNIEEGQRVEAGSVMAEIERTEYDADAKRAEGALARAQSVLAELQLSLTEEIPQAEAELKEAEAQLPQAAAAYQRKRDLLLRRVISPEEFELAESTHNALVRRISRLGFMLKRVQNTRAARLETAEAEVKQAEADLIKARWRLDNCTVRSPITGTILTKNAEQGNIVNPIAHQGSFSLCEMADLSDLEVDLKVPERDISLVFPGQLCVVRANAYRDRAYYGVVSRLMPIADPGNAAVPVRVQIDVPAGEEGLYLKPEMGAVATFYKKGAKLPPTIGHPAAPGATREGAAPGGKTAAPVSPAKLPNTKQG